ncbi:hypothetical protein DF147_24315 [Burkholderia cenocepacia]|nr:hypothetical protein DF147_24315 [Burkholderia cenocepacia]
MVVLPCKKRMPARVAAAQGRTRRGDSRHCAVLYRANASFSVKRGSVGGAGPPPPPGEKRGDRGTRPPRPPQPRGENEHKVDK